MAEPREDQSQRFARAFRSRRWRKSRTERGSWTGEAVTAVVSGLVGYSLAPTSEQLWSGAAGIVAGLIGIVLWHFLLNPIRRYIWVIPVEEHVAQAERIHDLEAEVSAAKRAAEKTSLIDVAVIQSQMWPFQPFANVAEKSTGIALQVRVLNRSRDDNAVLTFVLSSPDGGLALRPLSEPEATLHGLTSSLSPRRLFEPVNLQAQAAQDGVLLFIKFHYDTRVAPTNPNAFNLQVHDRISGRHMTVPC